jgi:hypothetical protein
MKISGFRGGLAQLADSFDSLREAWADTVTRWDDAASRRFCEHRLDPLEPIVRKALAAIQLLAETLTKIEQDCSDC